MKSFHIVHNDGVIFVDISDDGRAVVTVDNINDDEIVVRAINRAFRAGATTGTLFTGEVVDPQMARMHRMRAETGTTWLGGTVTQLDDGAEGPRFRIDWDQFPQVTE